MTSVEYSLLLALVATAALLSWEFLGCTVMTSARRAVRRFPEM